MSLDIQFNHPCWMDCLHIDQICMFHKFSIKPMVCNMSPLDIANKGRLLSFWGPGGWCLSLSPPHKGHTANPDMEKSWGSVALCAVLLNIKYPQDTGHSSREIIPIYTLYLEPKSSLVLIVKKKRVPVDFPNSGQNAPGSSIWVWKKLSFFI